MIGMKNRFAHIMYMPNKRHARFGIKRFEVVESKHSYILHTELYCGRTFLAGSNDPFTEKVVMFLLKKCNFTDNFYTKIPLAQRLYENDTYLTGTIYKNSKDLCKTLIKSKLGQEESLYFSNLKNTLLVGYRQKVTRKPVYLITIGCHAEDKLITSKKGKQSVKPVVINNHNLYMGGVDNKDKGIYHLTCDRATRPYWKKIFYNLLDMVLFNAYILYKLNTDRPLERETFIEDIVEAVDVPDVPGPAGDNSHKLEHLPGQQLRLCPVCSTHQKKTRSRFWCPGCNIGVHQVCYHKLQHYYRPTQVGRKRRKHQESEDDSD